MTRSVGILPDPAELSLFSRHIPLFIRNAFAAGEIVVRTHELSNIERGGIARQVVSPVRLEALLSSSSAAAKTEEEAQYAAQVHKGMIGLGTLHRERDGKVLPGMGGELVFLGGPWLIDENGIATRIRVDPFTPYAMLAVFDPGYKFHQHENAIPKAISNKRIPVMELVQRVVGFPLHLKPGDKPFVFDPNKAYAVRVMCENANLRLGSSRPPQRAGEGVQAISNEFVVSDEAFTLIGFYTPKKDVANAGDAGWRFSALRKIPAQIVSEAKLLSMGGAFWRVILAASRRLKLLHIQRAWRFLMMMMRLMLVLQELD